MREELLSAHDPLKKKKKVFLSCAEDIAVVLI